MEVRNRLKEHDELISEEVKDIISYRPHWMIRKGNLLFFAIISCMLVITWFISYPDVVNGSARMVSLNTPKLVGSKLNGKLIKLFVKNEDVVSRDQHLGYMESTSDYNQVISLQSWLNKAILGTQNNNYDILTNQPLPVLFNLGELQSPYQIFQNQLIETKQILASGYYQKKRQALEKDINYLSRMKHNTYKQRNLIEQDRQLQKKEYEAFESLEKDKVIAPLELNEYKTRLNSKDQSLNQINSELTNSDLAAHNKEKEIMDLQKSIFDQQQKFHSSILELKSTIEKWIQQYVFIAPENGKVLFASSLEENQLINNGQELMYIQPVQNSFYAEMMTAQRGFGKIRIGQKVILKLASYPSEEYGFIKGEVEYVSNIPTSRDSFLVKLKLPDGLRTSYHKNISFRHNLFASADIVTDDRRLFERLMGQLKKILDR